MRLNKPEVWHSQQAVADRQPSSILPQVRATTVSSEAGPLTAAAIPNSSSSRHMHSLHQPPENVSYEPFISAVYPIHIAVRSFSQDSVPRLTKEMLAGDAGNNRFSKERCS